jgi:uncharacterized lipoprotein NlpE involved in copper resistance
VKPDFEDEAPCNSGLFGGKTLLREGIAMRTNFVLLAALAFMLGMSACAANTRQPETTDVFVDIAHNSRNSLNWEGVYAGTIPAAGGPGIMVTLTLREDCGYTLRYQHLDRQGSDFTESGVFRWDQTGGVIELDVKKAPRFYRVGENMLIQSDKEGRPITGALAEAYVLEKQP